MTNSREAKVAIVTGASRGIGAAIAKRLAADGMTVVVNYAGRVVDAEAVVEQIRAAGGQAAAVRADVSNPGEVAALFDQAATLFGGVDILVNNAGIIQPCLPPLAETEEAMFDRMVAVNFKGTFNTLRLAARKLRDGGRIINFSTSVRRLALPGYSIYAATKAAVEMMTLILAKELRGRNITVNAVAPGPTATELFFTGKTPQQIETLTRMPPLERLGTPEDIAGVVAFLAGPDAAWVNGQTLYANGGLA